jgi:hypothetical protein
VLCRRSRQIFPNIKKNIQTKLAYLKKNSDTRVIDLIEFNKSISLMI